MKIGIDFDNTIICYDNIFNQIGVEKGLIPESIPHGKNYVRNYLRNKGQEDKWTELQGYVYGKRVIEAPPYDGVKDFFSYCRKNLIDCCIVSHKTLHPYSGYPYNLHKAANEWLIGERIDCEVFFELTKEEKIERISMLECTHFIDDLPEFLSLPGFPGGIVKILFDPLNQYGKDSMGGCLTKVSSWNQILSLFLQEQV